MSINKKKRRKVNDWDKCLDSSLNTSNHQLLEELRQAEREIEDKNLPPSSESGYQQILEKIQKRGVVGYRPMVTSAYDHMETSEKIMKSAEGFHGEAGKEVRNIRNIQNLRFAGPKLVLATIVAVAFMIMSSIFALDTYII